MMQVSYQRLGVIALVFLGVGLLIARGLPPATESHAGGNAILMQVQNKEDHVDPLDLAKSIVEGKKEYFIVDVRQPWEFDDYHVPGAVNIPLDQLMTDKARSTLPKDKTILLYSAGGAHAAQAWVLLAQSGYKVKSMLDGMQGWWRDVMTPASLRTSDEQTGAQEYKGAKSMREYFQGGSVPSGTSTPPVTAMPAAPSTSTPATGASTPPAGKKKGGGC